jgi:sugar phosphate isomerase/epimerase
VEEIAAYAKEQQVYVALENMELRKYELVYTLEDLNRFAYIGKDNPYFGVTLDFAHFSSHGIYEPDLSELKLPVLNIHLSQCIDGIMHKTLAGEGGVVHVPEVCKPLHDYGYTGRIIFEMGNGYEDSLEILRNIEIM